MDVKRATLYVPAEEDFTELISRVMESFGNSVFIHSSCDLSYAQLYDSRTNRIYLGSEVIGNVCSDRRNQQAQ